MDNMLAAIHQALGGTAWEIIAAVLALAYLVLAMIRSMWCWLCAFISSAIYVVLMARQGLPMDALLNLYYVVMAVYGYMSWRSGKQDDGEMKIVVWTFKQHLIAIGAILLLSSVSSVILQRIAPWLAHLSQELGFGYVQLVRSPWLDSFVTWSSVITTWMVARRVLENWLYWIVVDGVAAGLYWMRDLKYTSALFVIYVIMVIYGYFQWRRKLTLVPVAA
ncbi:MAG: nicotinamide riboside transporter PnuC [Steroidobacter sp.]